MASLFIEAKIFNNQTGFLYFFASWLHIAKPDRIDAANTVLKKEKIGLAIKQIGEKITNMQKG